MIDRVNAGGRRVFAPEVLQTSAMDCGPAALTCLLEGFGIRANYAAIQAACQTDLDGTSINTLEEMAGTLGLDAEQIMVPSDHVLLDVAQALPSLAVVQRERTTHFLILWRRHGAFVQVMDPAKGRRWLRPAALADELYIHRQSVPAVAWRAWAASPEFLGSMIERLRKLQIADAARDELVRAALADESWASLGLLDAVTRMVAELVAAKGLRAGAEAARVIQTITERARDGADPETLVPDSYWFAVPGDSDDMLVLRGAVLLRIRGRRETKPDLSSAVEPTTSDAHPPLIAMRADTPPQPLGEMWRLIADKRPAIPALLALGLVVAAAGALFEVMWLRGLLEISNVLSLREQRLATIAMLLGFIGGLMLLDLAITSAVLRIGRRVETRLRAALLEKLPRIGENYFQSRLVSDLAHRAHSLDGLRGMPDLGARFARASMQIIFTAIGLAWLDPHSAGVALAAAGLGLGNSAGDDAAARRTRAAAAQSCRGADATLSRQLDRSRSGPHAQRRAASPPSTRAAARRMGAIEPAHAARRRRRRRRADARRIAARRLARPRLRLARRSPRKHPAPRLLDLDAADAGP